MTLATRLHSLADSVDALPEPERAAIGRVLRRFERDRWIRVAAARANGCAGLLAVLQRDGWRIEVWLQRGKAPTTADPVLVALFHARLAGPLPTERHLRRICGHAMSETLDEASR